MWQQIGLGLIPLLTTSALGFALALVRWSAWWPHSDVRQIWANGATVMCVGLVLIGATLWVIRRRTIPPLAVALAVFAGGAAHVVGYDWLIGATIGAR